jgi:PAS domain-containing protein
MTIQSNLISELSPFSFQDCRVLRGIDAMICDSASMSVMIERIGCRNARWKQIKREKEREISCQYAINEDDMIMTDDILMCPFVFRSKNAVLCGALSDCVMPGMLTANFSKANKIQNLEIVFDAMGFMQQLDSANGCEVEAQVIPGSLEVALMACPSEARVITEAKPPFSIIHVNEAWTKLTKYSQLEVEGKGLFSLIQGTNTNLNAGLREGKPVHKFEEVAKGRPACSTSIHYDKFGNSFADFMSSYPLTK